MRAIPIENNETTKQDEGKYYIFKRVHCLNG